VSIIKNKALVRQAYDFLNRKELDAFFELLAPDYIEHLSNVDMSLEQAKQ
jgi:ketosteroid isomerase-like protein